MPENLILGSLLVLPYLSYLGLIGLAGFLVWSLFQRHQTIGRLLYRQGWLWLTLGMGVNVWLSYAPGETALQALNFVPFFGFYAAIAASLPGFKHPLQALHTWALGLVLATIPISLRALVEFYFNAPSSIARWSGSPWLEWLYSQPSYGHRADSVFGHPNFLANYLVICFGLGLGLCVYYLQQSRQSAKTLWLYGAMVLLLVGIFCSGSRNGLLIAGLQLLAFGWWMRRYRLVALAGIGAIVAMVTGTLAWGVGGRTLIQAFETITLRINVWRVAYAMLFDHPWIGNGLGTFKLQYIPFTVPEYDYLHHPHNLPLMLAVELGLPLTLLFIGIVGVIVFNGVKAFSTLSRSVPERAIFIAYGLGFGGHMLFAMFDLSFYDARVNVLGWLMLAVIQCMPTLVPAVQPSAPRST
jgi:hypothetical protein